MKVILTNNVKTVGNIGEIVNVSEGYARNYLIPNKLAKLADVSNAKQLGDYHKMLAKQVEAEKAPAQSIAKEVEGKTINLIKKIGGSGKIFGSVTNADISKELETMNINIERRQIIIPTPIKTLGTFDVVAKVFSGVEATFQVKVEMDPAQAEEMKKRQAAAEKKASKKAEAKDESDSEVSEEVKADAE